tara:strand:- start:53 stop:337 length:285 start_codon:yes stop_codon:yes gene_type:complete
MMKALLIVSALGGGIGSYEVEMPSMKECLNARVAIMEQDKGAKTLCVPTVSQTNKMQEFFQIFMGIVSRMKELENERDLQGVGSSDWQCEDCKG